MTPDQDMKDQALLNVSHGRTRSTMLSRLVGAAQEVGLDAALKVDKRNFPFVIVSVPGDDLPQYRVEADDECGKWFYYYGPGEPCIDLLAAQDDVYDAATRLRAELGR